MKFAQNSYLILLISFCVCPINASKQNSERNRANLVIGGKKVPIGGAPWAVSIIKNRQLICGGSLLTNKIVITAASCIKDVEPAKLLVRAGTTAFKNGGKLRRIKETIHHPKYVENSHSYNVALLHLLRPFNSTDKLVGQVKLPAANSVQPSSIYIFGWGLSSNKTSVLMTKNLRFTKTKIYSEKKCAQYLYEEDDTDYVFCSGDRTKTSDICTDDTGSPAIFEDNIQFGIVSDGGACSQTRTTILTNLTKHTNWIKNLISEFESEK
ncbi:trypsin-4-like [Zeugodacus cucurbitae]|uniref:Trypsin-4 n=1 Tax=Zeugodacus cucurbitae TaxID=28588 RepID=A0A0A1X1W3_ZEUCU|nr:trypsin-4-like [Zeugodacus cucurbitae]